MTTRDHQARRTIRASERVSRKFGAAEDADLPATTQHTLGVVRRGRGTRITALLALAVAAVAGSSIACAQNLVQNPNFNGSLAPWTAFLSSAPDPAGSGAANWVANVDANNNPASGSAAVLVNNNPHVANAASGVDQCIVFANPSTPVSSVNYGTEFNIPSGVPVDSGVNATVEIRLYSDAACATFIPGAGGSQGRTILPGFVVGTAWYGAGDPNFVPPAAPVLAGSARIRAYLRQTGVGATVYNAHFDNLFLSLNGSTPVELQSFDVE